jgi:hypothetical protein
VVGGWSAPVPALAQCGVDGSSRQRLAGSLRFLTRRKINKAVRRADVR